MNVLLTGATGFIGRQVIERLVARGDAVRALVRPQTLTDDEKMRPLKKLDGVKLVSGDMTDAKALDAATKNIEVVYHLALSYPSREGRQDFVSLNLGGAEKLLRASVASRVRRFVYTSSVAVYGWNRPRRFWPLKEDAPLQNPGTYARAKIDIEHLIDSYHQKHNFEFTILRPSMVYGPGTTQLAGFIRMSVAHPRFTLRRNPDEVLQLVHVSDVSDALMLAGTLPEAADEIFNIAGDEALTKRDLIALINRATDHRFGFGQRPTAFSNGRSPLMYDISKARAVLGFRPKVRLEDGIGETVAAMSEQLEQDARGPAPAQRRPRWNWNT